MKNALMPIHLFQQIEAIIREHSLDSMEEISLSALTSGKPFNTALLISDLASLGSYPGTIKNKIIQALESEIL